MKRDPIKHLRAECDKVLAQLERLREMPVAAVAEMFGRPRAWVRRTFPVIVHGPKSHSVRVSEIEAYQERRTMRPC